MLRETSACRVDASVACLDAAFHFPRCHFRLLFGSPTIHGIGDSVHGFRLPPDLHAVVAEIHRVRGAVTGYRDRCLAFVRFEGTFGRTRRAPSHLRRARCYRLNAIQRFARLAAIPGSISANWSGRALALSSTARTYSIAEKSSGKFPRNVISLGSIASASQAPPATFSTRSGIASARSGCRAFARAVASHSVQGRKAASNSPSGSTCGPTWTSDRSDRRIHPPTGCARCARSSRAPEGDPAEGIPSPR